MSRQKLSDYLLALANEWVETQENLILKKGIPLNEDQQIDAFLVGVKEIQAVRLLSVDYLPIPPWAELRKAAQQLKILSDLKVGMTFRYGICIRSDCWQDRNVIIHQLVHTMQYERKGGIKTFLKDYLEECLTVGYPNGSLEMEANTITQKISR